MTPPANLAAALEYARLGWAVFPLSPRAKEPLAGSSGFHDATRDEALIERWWEAVPDANVGIATGGGLWVVDIDPRHDGDKSLAALEAQHGPLPITVESTTGGGGRHLFFAAPCAAPSRQGVVPGIDLKADGGYVAVPFSTHPSGLRYHWVAERDPGDIKLAAPPPWLTALLVTADPELGGDSDTARGIPEGTRNRSLTSLAGTMQRRGMAPSAILAALLTENTERCVPPLARRDVERIVRSVTRYKPDAGADPSQPILPRQFRYADVISMLRQDPPPVEWVLHERIAVGDAAILVGPPYTGKSWVVLDLALTAALGLPTMGHFQHSRPRRVLVVDEENHPDEVWRRLRALLRAWGISPSQIPNLQIAQPLQGFSFRDVGYIKALQQQVEQTRPDLIVFDSLAAVASFTDENDNLAIRRFFSDEINPLRGVCDAAVLLVHHTSKAVWQVTPEVSLEGMARGGSALLDAVDSMLMLRRKDAQGTVLELVPLKVRRGARPQAVEVRIVNGVDGGARPIVPGSQGPQRGLERIQAILVNSLQAAPMRGSHLLRTAALTDMSASLKSYEDALAQLIATGVVLKNGEGAYHNCELSLASGFKNQL